MRLSNKASSMVNWARVDDGIRLVLSELDPTRSLSSAAPGNALPMVDHEVVRRAFDQAKGEFQKVLAPMKRGLQLAFGMVIASLALAISGVALSFLNPWGGGFLSLAGLGTMVGFFRRAWELNRDQAMLELVPARYELALNLSTSSQEYERILREFLKETATMRRR
jgi:hypothetical protein